MASLEVGDQAGTIAPLRRALEGFQRLGALWGLSVALFVSAQSAGVRGDRRSQVVLLSASDQLRTSVGAEQFPFITVWIDAAFVQAKAALGDEAFEGAFGHDGFAAARSGEGDFFVAGGRRDGRLYWKF